MGHINLSLSFESLGNLDSEVLVGRKIALMVLRLESSVVYKGTQFLFGREASSVGAGDEANGNIDLLRSSQRVLMVELEICR